MSDQNSPQEPDPQIEELPVEAVTGEDAESVKGGLLPAAGNPTAIKFNPVTANPGGDVASKVFNP